MSKPKGSRDGPSAEDFIRAWQRSATPDEFAQATGMRWYTAYKRASRYRRMGIPLKVLRRAHGGGRLPLDLVALADLARREVETKKWRGGS